MSDIYYVLVFSLIGGVISLLGGILLLSRKKSANAMARYATPFAAGALLAAVFLDLLKEGIEVTQPYIVLMMTLTGIIIFFFLERFLRWFHHHHVHSDDAADPSVGLIIVGDTVHNLLDGMAIAAAFLVSVPTGIVTTIAVAAHEIPQEIGDFGVLLNKGLSRKKVLLVNILSALATTVAALATFVWFDSKESVGILFGLSAGFLLYIALSDLIPEIHESSKKRLLDWQAVLLVLGVVTVGLLTNYAHRYIDAGHDHENETNNCVIYYDKDGHEALVTDCENDASDSDHL